MAGDNRELRPRLPKPPKPPPLTNAEKCRRHKEKIKNDPVAYEIFKMNNKLSSQKYLAGLSEEQKLEKREKDRLRQQKYRMKNKSKSIVTTISSMITPKKASPRSMQSTPNVKTREQSQKEVDKRERNRLSQQKRRSNMTPQRKRREREKRMDYYHKKKAETRESTQTRSIPLAPKLSIKSMLRGIVRAHKRSRSKIALFRLNFAKKILSKQPEGHFERYKRVSQPSFQIEIFFSKHAIDYPGQRNSSTPKKVLTKSLIDLYRLFKKEHPNVKCSLTTFKRRRPRNIILASSRKFDQCLCEKCTNAMLCMEVINHYLRPKSDSQLLSEKITNVHDLVNKTLCARPTKLCWERECSLCGSKSLLDEIKLQIGTHISTEKEYKRWGKNQFGGKDLIRTICPISSILSHLEEDLMTLAKHINVADWQRKQYQEITQHLPPRHAVCTVDFAENYLCRYQNEVQSAHWSYRQVSVHPCVFFYPCPECSKSVTEYLIFLSDDIKHDSFFTHTVFDKCISHLMKNSIVSVHIFSDGCGAQYKSKTTFMDLSELQLKYRNMSLTRHFFGSNHGKSLCDSSGGVVKNRTSAAVVSGEYIIQNAQQMFEFCQERLSVPDDNCLHHRSQRSFVLLNKDEIARPKCQRLLRPVPGTRQIHSLKPSRTELGVFSVSNLSCSCESCTIGEDQPCPSRWFSGGWRDIHIKHLSHPSTQIRSKSTRKVNSLDSIPPLHADSISDEILPQESMSMSLPIHNTLHVTSTEARFPFFLDLQTKLSSCQSFDDLVSVASASLIPMASFPLPTPAFRTVIEVGIVDKVALSLRPDGLDYIFPVLIESDGNCVPRSLSMLCFGDQDSHVEIRCRIAVELATNRFDYLGLERSELDLICQLSDDYMGSNNVDDTFKNETLSICNSGVFMGLWQLMAAANALGLPLASIYPPLGPLKYRKAMGRKFSPKESSLRSENALVLMWSSTRNDEMTTENWVANHVVPMLPLTISVILDVEEFV